MEVAVDPLSGEEVEGPTVEVEDEALNGGGLVVDGGDDGRDHVDGRPVRRALVLKPHGLAVYLHAARQVSHQAPIAKLIPL